MKKLLFYLPSFFATTSTFAQESIYNIKINDINGLPLDLNLFKGKYIMFVNVAQIVLYITA